MSASARRRRSRDKRRKLEAASAGIRSEFQRAPLWLARPEERKPHAARLVGPHDPTHIDGRRHDPRETEYSPLTVSTPLRDSLGRRSRARSAYTV